MDVYKEFVTNGLDLISFMLVTPELLRVFAPAVREAPTFIIYILFFGIPRIDYLLCMDAYELLGRFC